MVVEPSQNLGPGIALVLIVQNELLAAGICEGGPIYGMDSSRI